MDVERHLLSAIVADKDITPLADAGLTAKMFLDKTSRDVFETIMEHHRDYGSVPSVKALKMDFPEYKFIRVEDEVPFLIDRVKGEYQLSLLQEGLGVGVDYYDKGDADGAKQVLSELLQRLESDVSSTRDVNVTETTVDRLQHYRELAENGGQLLGMPTGFATLDRATQGLQKEQLITFVGPPKAGKSTVMLLTAMAAWANGHRPLLFTFEMSSQEMTQRLDSFRAGISNARLRTGALKREEWDRLERALHQMESLPDFFMSADSNSATTLTGIAAKIEKYKPDVVFVDGMYLLHDEVTGEVNTPQALTNLTRGFKRLAQNKQIPVAISSQVLEWKMDKKKGITSSSIGYSSSFAQDSDTIIGVERTDDDRIQKLKVVLARNCPSIETYVDWDWETGRFEELEANPFEEDGDGDASF